MYGPATRRCSKCCSGQPEAEYQGHDDDDLAGTGVDPVPQRGEERLRWLSAEAGFWAEPVCGITLKG
jgi:hypothetical protein